MKTKQRTINYPDLDLPCEICGQRFKTRQGLAGHKQFKHSSAAVIASNDHSPAGPDGPSLKELKGQVERLELEVKRRNLTAQLPSTVAHTMDIMESAGVGPITGEAQVIAQKRILGIKDQGQAESWLGKLLSSPEGVKTAIDGLKGILNVNNHQGDMATFLSTMGLDLKTLILNSAAPKSGSLEVAGLNLSGASLTPELLTSLIDYKAKTESAEKEFQGKKLMSDSLTTAVQNIGKELLGSFKGSLGRDRTISQEISDREPVSAVDSILTCPRCGHENELPADLTPGQKIECQGPECQESWVAIDGREQPKAQRQTRQVEVQEAQPATINCPSCGQLLDVSDKGIAESVVCPACQKEWTITSDNTAIKAEAAESEEEKQRQQFLHR